MFWTFWTHSCISLVNLKTHKIGAFHLNYVKRELCTCLLIIKEMLLRQLPWRTS